MAINLSKIKPINLKILVKNIFCVCTSSETLKFSNFLNWTNILRLANKYEIETTLFQLETQSLLPPEN
jgi:hypothetical protein